ncbi:hypothetical protein A2331_04340 [Candidatus Falkowbacteria bacterium RIFOXYB2_FULL_34_18]|uniref:Uncharacterized protein n=1 Tax=Candidatus Falkowbacteria bacterium RIFOXYD2_FULL_34_120 TaxID=1798007 RepID=A0A1F5TM26_9BACT|nr:MAG: hypothetical protein A2331_04340 [Candidatus Falkowbacteria bacterium RIFOXYB2_FULL_34_18]OGF30266.1 MAG: hypothetical protein A2500_06715 [Candidatus Falkowbacteria bacterium RIFOXYC12_FULL_34_55]OGF37818.1 MAG: hypothetical protein A2466_03845 [Candidatus Falkowbacteria bacterium RIFOXYC2_FULL_34_220]OGF39579.1 MAG: hypothetical protein A2515_03560 [Candidatus Falkowbacteria bacterium RIFOXYD12_FULL_34_57]OGF40002.1 MAG: hypothetical protein A2531_07285 [Candidatus Falkowbacteria bact
MNDDDKKLLQKFENVVGKNMDEQAAVMFFAKLSLNEYNRLIEIFANNYFPNIKDKTKQKVLVVLKKLKETLKNKRC